MRNFGTVGLAGRSTTEELTGYLKKYSSANSRIRKPQFHVAVSCKGREMTESELLDFAHQYLKEMGYAELGQPWLFYAHHDTDNTHLHIITSRVAPDGRKIAHSHERRRSQEVIDRILGTDRQKRTENDITAARQYTFSSFAQFKAIMVSMRYIKKMKTYLSSMAARCSGKSRWPKSSGFSKAATGNASVAASYGASLKNIGT